MYRVDWQRSAAHPFPPDPPSAVRPLAKTSRRSGWYIATGPSLYRQEASSEEIRRTFVNLANKWMMLAGDLESAQALLHVAKDEVKREG